MYKSYCLNFQEILGKKSNGSKIFWLNYRFQTLGVQKNAARKKITQHQIFAKSELSWSECEWLNFHLSQPPSSSASKTKVELSKAAAA